MWLILLCIITTCTISHGAEEFFLEKAMGPTTNVVVSPSELRDMVTILPAYQRLDYCTVGIHPLIRWDISKTPILSMSVVASGWKFDDIPATATISHIEAVANIESATSGKGKRADNTTLEMRGKREGTSLWDSVQINYLPMDNGKGKRQKVEKLSSIYGKQEQIDAPMDRPIERYTTLEPEEITPFSLASDSLQVVYNVDFEYKGAFFLAVHCLKVRVYFHCICHPPLYEVFRFATPLLSAQRIEQIPPPNGEEIVWEQLREPTAKCDQPLFQAHPSIREGAELEVSQARTNNITFSDFRLLEQAGMPSDANIHELSIEMGYQAEDFDPSTVVLREELALATKQEIYPIAAAAPWITEPRSVTFPKYCFKRYWGNVGWTTSFIEEADFGATLSLYYAWDTSGRYDVRPPEMVYINCLNLHLSYDLETVTASTARVWESDGSGGELDWREYRPWSTCFESAKAPRLSLLSDLPTGFASRVIFRGFDFGKIPSDAIITSIEVVVQFDTRFLSGRAELFDGEIYLEKVLTREVCYGPPGRRWPIAVSGESATTKLRYPYWCEEALWGCDWSPYDLQDLKVVVRPRVVGNFWGSFSWTVDVTCVTVIVKWHLPEKVNNPPTGITLHGAASVAENAGTGTQVGTGFTAADPDTGDSHTFALVSGTGSTDNAKFYISGNRLYRSSYGILDYETQPTLKIRVRTTDSGGLWYEAMFTISVTNVNEKPTGITLSPDTYPNTHISGDFLGTLTCIDDGGSHTFSLVSGTGDADNANFAITGSGLYLGGSFTKTSYSIRVRCIDSGGLWVDESKGIKVTVVNKAPTDLRVSPAHVAENKPINTIVGTLETADPNTGDTHTYTFVSGGADNSKFNIYGGNKLRTSAQFNHEQKSSYSIKIRTTDPYGASFVKELTISIDDVKEPPRSLTLIGSSINEGSGANAVIGTLSATDPDAGATLTYVLVSGTGDDDNAKFNIAGNQLRETASLNYEAKSTLKVRIRVKDNTGLYVDGSFTIVVIDVNEPPTDIKLTGDTVTENAAVGTVVGTLSATDPDSGSTFSYQLIAISGSSDHTAFDIDGNQLKLAISPDYEDQSTYTIKIRVSDGSLTRTENFVITVKNVNEPPVNLKLSSTTIAENGGSNVVVGALSASDPEGHTLTYALVSGFGDNAKFNIAGTSLRATSSFDFETKKTYSVRVRVSDDVPLSLEKTFTITVLNVDEPPTDFTLADHSISENAGNNAVVGTLSASDPEGHSLTYALVSGTGSDDNSLFNIYGAQLRATNSLNYEDATSRSVRIRVSDGAKTKTQVFTINVLDVKEPPNGLSLSNNKIAENAGNNVVVGTLSATDPEGKALTYSLVSGSGSTDNAKFNINGAQLRATNSFNYESKKTYSVRVRVTDPDNLSMDNAFTISVTNVNEPPTALSLSPSSIAENAGSNANVGTLSATDPEGAALTYSLVAGTGDTHNSLFNIYTNKLRADNSFNHEAKSSYSVRVEASDGTNTVAKAFTISVLDKNEAPTNIQLSPSTILENSATNTVIGTLSTTDVDSGDTFSYIFVSGTGDDDNSKFNIYNGKLRSSAGFNFEVKNSYTVRIQSKDSGGLAVEKALTIKVTNQNEKPTDITLSASSINENKAAGTVIGTLGTHDPDSGDSFTYTLVSGTGSTDNAKYVISGTSLKSSEPFDREEKSQHSIRIRSKDAGGLYIDETFTITVNNVNEAPYDISLSSVTVSENVPIGTTVGTFSTSDPDAGDSFTYSFASGTNDNSKFTISGTALKTASAVDYETKASYAIKVTTKDAGGLTYTKSFTIRVSRANDAPTKIVLSKAEIPENRVVNTIVGTLTAEDQDSGDSHTFALVSGAGSTHNSQFNINEDELRTSVKFDYESETTKTIRIRATDSEGAYYEQQFQIKIINANEAPTGLSLSNTVIAENEGADIVVGTFSANDPDSGTTLSYSLISGTGSTDNGYFYISGTSLKATNSFDYETDKTSYSIRVQVSDGSLTQVKVFTITLTNVNERPRDLSLSNTKIAENEGANALVGTLSASDPDAGTTLSYDLISGTGSTDNGYFIISGTSLKAKNSFDYETDKTSYSIRVQVSDGSLTLAKVFTITLTNVNEPPFGLRLVPTNIDENLGANAVVGTLSAIDPDAGTTLTYALVAGTGSTHNSQFNIYGNKLRATNPLDHEAQSTYYVRIEVSDGTNKVALQFVVTVDDVNEPPRGLSLSESTVPENAGINAVVGTLSATDPDAGTTLNYELVSGANDNSLFNIDGTSLRASNSFDYETRKSYSVLVAVSDGSLGYEKEFPISVTNVNEAPTDIRLSSTSINENSGANAVVGTLSTSDPEGGTFIYTLVSGTGSDDNAEFDINDASLRAKSSLDYETKPSYNIRIRTTDSKGKWYEKKFEISVKNRNEPPTDISLTSNKVAENAGANVPVGTLSASDPEGGTLTFDVVSGTTYFAVSGTSLIAKSSFNYESRTSHNIRIRVTDSGDQWYEEEFNILVTNVNEPPTVPTLDKTKIAENSGANAVVGKLSASDPDAGATLTFSLVAGTGATDNSQFYVDGVQLKTKYDFDYETKKSYSIRIKVSDGSLSKVSIFDIDVTNVNESPHSFTLSPTNINENEPANSLVGTLSADDPDANTHFSYSFVTGVGDDDNNVFSIVNGNELRADPSFNYETKSTYSVRITVSDGSISVPKAFEIDVNDVNEAPTAFTLSNSRVEENKAVNTHVGSFTTTDPDNGETFTYTLTSGTDYFSISNINELRTKQVFDYEKDSSYSIKVKSTDSEGLSIERSFAISITNKNEQPTDILLSGSSIYENKPENTVIGTLSTVEPDNSDPNSFTYTLVSGTGSTDNAKYVISGASLKSSETFDREEKSQHSIRIRSTDDGGLSTEKSFTITVKNVNEAPYDISLTSVAVPENVPIGTTIGSFSTSDHDVGDTFTYEFAAGTNDNDQFSILDKYLRTNTAVDYEQKSSYVIQVRTKDKAGASYVKSFTLVVTSGNDAPTLITLDKTSIPENRGTNAVVGSFSTTDEDTGDTFTYTLVSGAGSTNNAQFDISQSQLLARNSFNYESKSSYSIRVRSTDSGSLYTERQFTIDVTNVNEKPTDIKLSKTSIAENAGANAVVGALSATDPDAGSSFTYSLVSGTGSDDNTKFNINNAQLRATNAFNYETKKSYSVRIEVSDGSLTYQKSFTIDVTNVNEKPTDIKLSKTSIEENAAANAVVGTLSATDPDAGSSFTYELVSGTGSGDNSYFNINDNQLRATNSFNYETKSSYSVRIEVSDGSLAYQKAFTIAVTDVNEKPTGISLSKNTIAENAGANAVVGTLSATDPDASQTFTYKLVSGTGSDDNSYFNINGNQLRATNSFDKEARSSYSVRIEVSDGSLTYQKSFDITVKNVNEAPTDISLSQNTIPENSAAYTVVGTLSASDPDAGSSFSFQLVSGTGSDDNAKFNIFGTQLRATNQLNYESNTKHTVRVEVSDGSLTFAKPFDIFVTNVNEAPTSITLTSNTINENAGNNAIVGTLKATDPDAGTSFSFSLVSGSGDTDNGHFNIQGTQLRAENFDFESQSKYTIRIGVSDGSLSYSTSFTINVRDMNEPPTDISLTGTSVAENAGANAVIGTLGATDPDAGETFTFKPLGTYSSLFNVFGNKLRATSSFNYEAKSSYPLTIEVSDGSITFTKDFEITVTDVNERPTDITLSKNTIPENAAANAVVGTLSTNDPDKSETRTYTLVTGTGSDDNAKFNIHGTSLRATSAFDFETRSSYSVRIQVSDGTYSYADAFAISVTNVNEAPTDIDLSKKTIAENAGSDVVVGTLSADDVDSSSLTFKLVSGTGSDDNALFYIDGVKLTASSSFDHETKSSRNVRIEVSDGSLTFEKPFTIDVTNVNERPTDIKLSKTSIAENAGSDVLVGTLSASDPDSSSFTYKLVSGSGSTDNAMFTISGTQLRAVNSIDYETKTSCSVRIQVSDGSLTFEEKFIISVTDVNEAPTDISLSPSSIRENRAVYSVIGTFSASDPDAGSTFTYSLVSGTGSDDNDLFNIEVDASDTAKLTSKVVFDREAKSSYSIRVRVADDGTPTKTYDEVLIITIDNVNEAPTHISLSSTSIATESTIGTVVGTFSTDDPDVGDSFTYAFATGGADNSAFKIDDTKLVTAITFDYLEKDTYNILVRSTDAAGLSVTQDFSIIITSDNDAPTDITLSLATVPENKAAGTLVGTLTAVDTNDGDTFTFALVSGGGSTDNLQFDISGNRLITANSFNFEQKSSYSIRIRVTDDGRLTFEKQFTIRVTNVNEQPTGLILTPTSIAENAGSNAVVGTLTASDPDAETTLSFDFVSGAGDTDNAKFNIFNQNQLRASNSFDYEGKSSYSVRIEVSDGSLTSQKAFTIDVTNVNERPTDIKLSKNTIAENAGANAVVGTLSATDPDADTEFTYSLVSGAVDNSEFNINGNQLRATKSFNFESQKSYTVRIQVSDGDLTFAESFTIDVTNVNEAPTDISLSPTSIKENAGNNAIVGTLSATDPDAGTTFTFSLVSGAADNIKFNIDGTSLRATNSFDFEDRKSYSVQIRVSDGADSYTETFTIDVTNVNERPTDISLTSTSIDENAGADALVGTLSADDVDSSSFTYKLVSGSGSTNNDQFEIVGASLKAKNSFNYEAKSSYSIRIEVSDGSLTYSEAFIIGVRNVNERPTDITLSKNTIAENSVAGAVVGTLSASDPDSSSFTFTLVSGSGSTNNDQFDIVESSLVAKDSFNFEGKSSYSVRIEVSDGSLSYSEAFTIKVLNVWEAPTDITLSPSSIAENAAANTVVGTFTTADVDKDEFVYTLVSGSGSGDNSKFDIDGDQLRANAPFDFEKDTSFSIRVETKDKGGLTLQKKFSISVTNVNEAPTAIQLSSTSIEENAGDNAVVGTFTTSDPDAGTTFTYALVDGAGSTDNAQFKIAGTSLTAANSFDYEEQTSYSIRVRTKDSGGLTFEKSFDITIINQDEAPTDISLSSNTINENLPANTVVGTLSTTDVDSTVFAYILTSGSGSDDNDKFTIVGDELRTAKPFNYESDTSYTVRVRSTDQGNSHTEKAFTITIKDLNEAPTDIKLSSLTIDENVAANAVIGTLSTVDPDGGNTFTYSLVTGAGSDNNDQFTVSGNELRSKAEFDYEAKSVYTIRIRTTDQDDETYEEMFTITVNNVNEPPTDISLSSFYIPDNSNAGIRVGTFTTTDQDISDSFTYTFKSGDNDNSGFKIVEDELRTAKYMDDVDQSVYAIQITATDKGGLSFDKDFTVYVSTGNDPPTDITLSTVEIAENQGANALIGTLSTVDPDEDDTFTYNLVSGTGSDHNENFQISGAQLRSRINFDYETQKSYSVRIRSTDNGDLYTEEYFVISINNENEAPSEVKLSSTSIKENQAAGTAVGTLSTSDPDNGDKFTYTLTSGDDKFQIVGTELTSREAFDYEDKASYDIAIKTTDEGGLSYEGQFIIVIQNVNEPPTDISLTGTSVAENAAVGTVFGTLSAADPDVGETFDFVLPNGYENNNLFKISGTQLQTNAQFNYEVKQSYKIRVRVIDSRGNDLYEDYTVTVTDVSEAPTSLELSPTSIAEDSAANAVVGTLTAADEDAGTTFTYSLISGTGSDDNDLFSISGDKLRAGATFDHEDKSSYSVRIEVSDGSLTLEKAFTIDVTDVNEAPTDISLTSATIDENREANAVVGTLSASDPDAEPEFTYSLVTGTGSADNDQFNIAGNQLRASNSLNFEQQSSYSVRVQVSDGTLAFSKPFTITVRDVNESPSDIGLSSTDIKENEGSNAIVGVLSAVDEDADENFDFSLVLGVGADDNSAFTIVGNQLRAKNSFDAETRANYNIRIRVSDGDLSYEEQFKITVLDVNEPPTDITLSSTSIDENKPTGTKVATVETQDPDADDDFTWELISGGSDFKLEGNELSSIGVFDYETKKSYSISIKTTDKDGESIEKSFTINVQNVNEAPTDISLSSFYILEESPVGTLIGTFSTADVDSGDTFKYEFDDSTSNDNDKFEIQDQKLVTLVVTDYDDQQQYIIRVTTIDAEGLSYTKSFTIYVTSGNIGPTDISLSRKSIDEHNNPDAVIGTLSTVDADTDDTFTYKIVSGAGSTDNDVFAIESDKLITKEEFDYETKDKYFVRIRSTDNGDLYTEKSFQISVQNVNEQPVDITLSAFSIPENSPVNSLIGEFSTSDPDKDDEFEYSLVSGDDEGTKDMFKIDNSNLFTKISFNYEDKSSYNIRIRSTDKAGLSFEKSFTILVTNVNEAPEDISLSGDTINYNVPPDTLVGTFTTKDPDQDEEFVYEKIGGSPLFYIQKEQLRTKEALALVEEYVIEVRSTDKGGLVFEKSFTINVDFGNAPTDIVLSSTSVAENLPLNTEVGIFTSEDADEDETFTYALVTGPGDTNNAQFHILGSILRTNQAFDYESVQSLSVRVQTTDQGGLTFQKAFLIDVTNVNERPTALFLDGNVIPENQAFDTLIGNLSAVDPDGDTEFTFALISGSGGINNNDFNIVENHLRSSIKFNFESKSSYSVRISATDAGGLSVAEPFTITIIDLNDAPTNIQLTSSTVPEHQPVHTLVGTLTTTDPDASDDTFVYALVANSDSDQFVIEGDELYTNSLFDYKTKPSYTLRIKSTDERGLSVEKQFIINVQNVNEAPSDVMLTSTAVQEKQPIGTLVGVFVTTDPDRALFTYSLVSGEGSDDNPSFLIDADELQTGKVLDASLQSNYSIRIRAADSGGMYIEKRFQISVIPLPAITTGNVIIEEVEKEEDIDFSAGGANYSTCLLCGQSIYSCSDDDSWGAGQRSFFDPSPSRDHTIASISVETTYMKWCGENITLNIYLQGELLGSIFRKDAACDCDTCPGVENWEGRVPSSIGYAYNSWNTLKIVAVDNSSVCIGKIKLSMTFQKRIVPEEVGNLEVESEGEADDESGLIAGLLAAFIACCMIAAIVAFIIMKKRKKDKEKENEEQPQLQITDGDATQYYGMDLSFDGTQYSAMAGNKIGVFFEFSHLTKTEKSTSPVGSIRPALMTQKLSWVIAYNEIEWISMIGAGAYGEVWKGLWKKRPVAVKKLKNVNEQLLDEFNTEANLMMNLRPHPNIVLLQGICMEPMLIVTEFMDNGSLFNLLHSDQPITEQKLLKFIKGIARGMNHLHSEHIVHRDLATRNILLTKSLAPKITDFGMSRFCEGEKNTTQAVVGPLLWMAPESLTQQIYSPKSDVWSFGVVITEILNRKEPYTEHTGISSFQIAHKVVHETITPAIPQNTNGFVIKLLEECLQHDPSWRLSSSAALEKAEELTSVWQQ